MFRFGVGVTKKKTTIIESPAAVTLQRVYDALTLL